MAEKALKNIIDYVRQELSPFDKKQFNDVDSLVLSQLSYVHFNGLIKSVDDMDEPVTIGELLKAEYFETMFSSVLNGDKSKDLLFAMAASPRFRDIRVNYYEECIDAKAEEQFSSVTYLLPFGLAYVAFRGTDTTLIGWKEDFNMAFMQTVPSQKSAKEQLNKVARLLDMPLITGGHSKGGNLATYAAAKCHKDVQDRVTCIYSHDGPGFRKDVVQTSGFEEVFPKVKKTVPEFSMIGMLLQHQSNYNVVESDEKFLMQHDPFSWKVGEGDFVYTKDISSKAYAINESISQWLENVDDISRERFVDVLFHVINSSGAKSVQDLEGERYKNAMAILDALKGIEPETRRFVFQTVTSFATLSVKNLTVFPGKKQLLGIKKKIEKQES